MKEILFRGKEKGGDRWVYGFYFTGVLGSFIIPQAIAFPNAGMNRDVVEVEDSTVGQFTGVIDDNDVKIFDGDIVETLKGKFTVEWNDDKNVFQFANDSTSFYFTEVYGDWKAVVGTIHNGESK